MSRRSAHHGLPALLGLLLVAGTAQAQPYLVVLGIGQDAGVPQAGASDEPGWDDPAFRRRVVCLALVDGDRRWLFEATPDFREQLHTLNRMAPPRSTPGLAGIFLTHAHIGHYTGLMFLGHESMGTQGTPVYALPRMRAFLRDNGPWSQLVRFGNIALEPIEAGRPVVLSDSLRVTPFLVPHRQEYSEVAGYRIEGPHRRVLFIPDIDSWEAWDAAGTRLEDVLRTVDVAYVDGSFFANGEIPGRDMTGFPHPFITHTMDRLREQPAAVRARVRFIHLNHTNPALWPGTPARKALEAAGFRVAEEGERVTI